MPKRYPPQRLRESHDRGEGPSQGQRQTFRLRPAEKSLEEKSPKTSIRVIMGKPKLPFRAGSVSCK